MEIILKKNVDKLGYEGDVVTVKAGYGRNFLIPQGYAVLATDSAKKMHAENMRQKSHKENQIKEAAQAIASKLDGLTVKVKAKVGDNDKIFGSITTIALSEALKGEGIEIDRKSLTILTEPVKELGTYDATANLHKEVSQEFKFEVIAE
ncbi:50S ribosomal protein L9 [Paracrocinitomix mangrovi]|uniref:50S ribosomal protein L9 n=1 Tax=Paracrocinitomix mangrovi TaxID=2862509 RepID=UPI001C8E0CE7|nr:50S ribosomal protein L9 [Paracrocinitomix mangrovi]UKN02113.1 50S ribosomal protein L9 [Paracrocinitomix mangrovi]